MVFYHIDRYENVHNHINLHILYAKAKIIEVIFMKKKCHRIELRRYRIRDGIRFAIILLRVGETIHHNKGDEHDENHSFDHPVPLSLRTATKIRNVYVISD